MRAIVILLFFINFLYDITQLRVNVREICFSIFGEVHKRKISANQVRSIKPRASLIKNSHAYI